MVSLHIYSQTARIKFKSTIISKATFFILITKILKIILPFILAYNSRGFWLKTHSFHEQPDIKFKYKYIFVAETNILSEPILSSNIINFDTINDIQHRSSMIKIREIDNNDDGKYDELLFSLTIDKNDTVDIESVFLILLLDYQLQTCPLQMETVAIVQYLHNKPGVRMKLIGDLGVVQNKPLSCKFNVIEPSIININHRFELWNCIKEHFARKLSTKIDNSYILWTSGKSSTFSLDIQLRYPEQELHYKPNFWQVIKFAWIQYLSLFIVFLWIINKIEHYVFTNKLVLYHTDKSEMKKLQ